MISKGKTSTIFQSPMALWYSSSAATAIAACHAYRFEWIEYLYRVIVGFSIKGSERAARKLCEKKMLAGMLHLDGRLLYLL